MAYIKKKDRLKLKNDFLKKHKDFSDFINCKTDYFFDKIEREKKRDELKEKIIDLIERGFDEDYILRNYKPRIKEIESAFTEKFKGVGFFCLIIFGIPLYGYFFFRALHFVVQDEALLPIFLVLCFPFVLWAIRGYLRDYQGWDI
tara:strand:- start:2 stop:436 length:435 start_codon:yes stop_codon:yes gene_type:complete